MRTKRTIILACIFMLISACAMKPEYQDAPLRGQEVRVDIASLQEGVPSFYTFLNEQRRVDFFVVLVNGVPESYLDACRKCSPKKKGYKYADGYIICVACGERYHISELQGVGSCHPIPLSGTVEGDAYVIKATDLSAGSRYF